MPDNGNRANTARGSRPGSPAHMRRFFGGVFQKSCRALNVDPHPGLGLQTTSDRPIVRISAITEMIVSQTDQVLIVWTTVIPKYSFTNQKPPSLT